MTLEMISYCGKGRDQSGGKGLLLRQQPRSLPGREPDPPPLQYWLPHVLRRCSSSGSLAMLEAMRRASSWGQPPHRHAPACEIAYMRQSYHSSAALMGGQEVKP